MEVQRDQERGATGAMEGAAGGGVATAAFVPVGAAGAIGGVGDCAMSTAAMSVRVGSGGIVERESVGAHGEIGITDYSRESCSG